ncbi:MAG: protease inhibitor Inh/omp19 family protein [Aurantimonas endophytica]|uniref:Alkaline proteinase inhibitor/ Outer membrane lipoprotein Omp19 domain-containing protein n=1 Tax=Aurantimonas endophytica TaxID=1522175 RepID=A0A7W6MRH5_9HYPH|nr:protease inhibitor Inh/omp19 family protein [Aurantimonas endophytica]MBB4005057.1 hypothetical protein [Aurantimonas endophytica]MCO6406277.1 AprI/Inh family metalloprotease inhibitor [Aurantimonas endophytica]
MTRSMKTGVALAALLVAAGCSRSMPTMDTSMPSGPSSLTPAPTGQVASNQLPPPPPPPPPSMTDMNAGTDTAAGAQNGAAGGSQVASLGSGQPLTRGEVLGAYRVTTTGGNCQIILSLTQWTGGYRAASRGCPGAVADVSAWDVSGSQVVLKDSGGTTVANLNSAGGARYEGTTTGGQQISLYR